MIDNVLPFGRRERNKNDKQQRIFAAASSLFADHGYAAVTTQQIAALADVSNGTIFRYASTKAELLVMVYNVGFREAVEEGRVAMGGGGDPAERVVRLVTPLVMQSRLLDENTAVYQREVLFGEPSERYRAEGRAIAGELNTLLVSVLEEAGASGAARGDEHGASDSSLAAHAIFNVVQLEIARSAAEGISPFDLLANLERQIGLMMTGFTNKRKK
jgi:AcrR family transcriptional regulator